MVQVGQIVGASLLGLTAGAGATVLVLLPSSQTKLAQCTDNVVALRETINEKQIELLARVNEYRDKKDYKTAISIADQDAFVKEMTELLEQTNDYSPVMAFFSKDLRDIYGYEYMITNDLIETSRNNILNSKLYIMREMKKKKKKSEGQVIPESTETVPTKSSSWFWFW